MRALDKYLNRYAEPEALQLSDFPSIFNRALAIPMYCESLEAVNYFCEFAGHHSGSLLILVINRPDDNLDTVWAQTIFKHFNKATWQSANKSLSLHCLGNSSAVLLVDRCLNGSTIPKDQGVGLARKIANDIACKLIAVNKLISPWVYNTDADARLPNNYFSIDAISQKDTAAILFNYHHIASPSTNGRQADLSIATKLYQLSLYYYVAGLSWAQSPYAYHSLGSIIALNAFNYAQVRGFPKRAGAEDFYLLNKLAKTGIIKSYKNIVIKLISRESNRVPFGTGPAVTQIIQSGDLDAMPFYDPLIFSYLKVFLVLLKSIANNNSIESAINNIASSDIDILLIRKAIADFNVDMAADHCHKHGRCETTRLRHLTTWFDAFKTLKFLHFIRDHKHPMLPYSIWQQKIKNHTLAKNLAL